MKYALKRWTVLTAFLSAGYTGAFGAPVTYSELVSGDLSDTFVGTLDVGDNTVQGRFCFTPDPEIEIGCPEGVDFDTFRFTLPAGLAIEDVTFTFVTLAPAAVLDPNTEFDFRDSAAAVLAWSGVISLSGSGSVSLFESVLPLSDPDTYQMWHARMRDGPFSTEYIWTLQVGPAQVGEPATFALLGVALLLMTRRRKQHGQG